MYKNVHLFIKELRKKTNYSQEYISKKLGISRPTYIQIEKGERELSLKESKILCDLYGISFENLISGKFEEKTRLKFEKENKSKKKSSPDIRISVPRKNIRKFKEVLLYILEKVGAKPNIGETVIYKLLYFIDFDYYEKYEEQIIGATYIKNKYGPTPVEFIKIINEMTKAEEIIQVRSSYFEYEQKKYLPLRSADLAILSARELSLINDVLNRLSDKSAKELSEYSHSDTPWQIHEFNEIINYESVFYRDHEHSVRNYDEL
jgi:transcriptional regulator with XRE-family HTH domain